MLPKTPGSSRSQQVLENKTVVKELFSPPEQKSRKQINARSYVQSKKSQAIKKQGKSKLHTASSTAEQ